MEKKNATTSVPELTIHTDELLYPKSHLVNGREREIDDTFIMRAGKFFRVLYPGFRCNGGSVPRFAWWFQSPWTGKGVPGFWGHDGDYKGRRGWKILRDWNMLKTHAEYGVSFIRRKIVFLVVVLFGWPAWWKGGKDSPHVEYIDVDDIEGLRLAVRRGRMIARLRREQHDLEGKTKYLESEILALERHEIDPFLKQLGEDHD